MRTWVTRKEKPVYGLGLVYGTFAGNNGYGHSGGGIGAGCQLYYFPEKEVYVFVAINLGTVTDSPIHKKVEGIIDELYQTLLN
jgi:D-alanyl-D-alanine carboxypeptidase